MRFLVLIFSFNLFSANINLFTQAQLQERAQVESLLNSFNDNLITFCNYNLSKDDQDHSRLEELKQVIANITSTCDAFLEEAKQDHTMPKLLRYKEFTKSSLVVAASTIGLFLQKLSGNDNDNFSLQNLNQESKVINKIKNKLNELQIAQKTILTLISLEEINIQEEPITEVVIEPNTDRDEEIAGLVNFELNHAPRLEQENQEILATIEQRKNNQTNQIIPKQKEDVDEVRLKLHGKSKKDIITNAPLPPFCNLSVSDVSKNIEKPEIFEKLPTEIWALIISNLDVQDQKSFLKTCKFAKSLIDNHGNYLGSKIENFHFIDNNWLIYFEDKELYSDEPRELSLFYRLDSNSCFNLIKIFIALAPTDKSFTEFLKKTENNKIYLLFTGCHGECSIYALKNLFSDKKFLDINSIISTSKFDGTNLTSILKKNNFYNIYSNYFLKGKEKIYLESYLKHLKIMKNDVENLSKEVIKIEKYLQHISEPIIDYFKNSITKEQYNRITNTINDDILLSALKSDDTILSALKSRIIDEESLIRVLFYFKKSQNIVNKKIEKYNSMHLEINDYSEKINSIKNSIFLYSFMHKSLINSIKYDVDYLLRNNPKKEYTYINEDIKIIQRTDEQVLGDIIKKLCHEIGLCMF